MLSITRALILLASLLAISSPAAAQVSETWSRVDASEGVLAVVAFPGGGIANSVQVSNGNDLDTVLQRFDAAGNLRWKCRYDSGHGTTEALSALAVDAQGNLFAAGSDRGSIPGGYRYAGCLVKLDPNGMLLWSREYDPTVGMDYVSALTVDAQGSVYATGESRTPGPSTSYAAFVVKYDAQGNLIYDARWNDPLQLENAGRAIAVEASGEVTVCGEADRDSVRSDVLALRWNAAGTLLWARTLTLGPSILEVGTHLALGPGGSITIAGDCGPVYSAHHAFELRLDSSGNTLWNQVEGDTAATEGLGVDAQGNAIVLQLGLAPDPVSWLRKRDPAGNLLWQRVESATYPHALCLDSAGDSYVFGMRWHGPGLVEHWNRDGVNLWTHRVSGPSLSYPFGALDSSGGIYATAGAGYPQVITLRLEPQCVPYCFGDGSGASCPCANESPAGERLGCTNSSALGARLEAAGAPSLASDRLVLLAAGMSGTTALFFQGNALAGGGSGIAFGDGLLCANGNRSLRLATEVVVAGAARYPNPGEPELSLRGAIVAPGPHTYQVFYRDLAATCTGAGFNLTNGVLANWQP